MILAACVLLGGAAWLWQRTSAPVVPRGQAYEPTGQWTKRAYAIGSLFHRVYSAGWEGANGAIGDAYLYKLTGDLALLRFHTVEHDMRTMVNGTWVDDRAWICLAELYWWEFSGKTNSRLVADAEQRYQDARREGRLSHHEGYWSWYNWPPGATVGQPIFTNSNMNQMVNVACRLYEATGKQMYLDDARRVWYGDGEAPGIFATLYHGNGVWTGRKGKAAFGKQLPWEGTEYCSIGAPLYRITKDSSIKNMIVATAKRILDPKHGWVNPADYYQIHMDGNGAFVHYLLDAYLIAPEELGDIPLKVEKMLEHVWSNGHGRARVVLHRTTDDAIRNGWNPSGGEDGYGVNEVGTVHAQSQALRAFGVFAYYKHAITASPPR